MAGNPVITAEYVRQLLDYHKETGSLIWKPRAATMFSASETRSAEWICKNWNARHAGKVAGCVRNDGYCRIRIDYVLYYGHRVAWLIETGEWPLDELDHRFGTTGDYLENLRPASHAQNMQNRRTSQNNTSGHPGVSWSRLMSKWHAYVGYDSRREHLGFFDVFDDAVAAYLAAKQKRHPFQPSLRKIPG